MPRNLVNLVNSVNQAQRRLRDTTPQTTEWLDAQRDAVHARAVYWNAMCLDWDLHHPRPAQSS
jgi:hypothetical protein